MSVQAAETRTDYIAVRFEKLGRLYHYRVDDSFDVDPGDHVVVKTRRGRQLGQVVAFVEPEQLYSRRNVRTASRLATPRDLVMHQAWQEKELEALIACREQASQLGLKDVKFVKAEYNFEGTWLAFLYSAENRKINLKQLHGRLKQSFEASVELRMIGPRDVAKIMGGYGACGAPRCCSTFLTEFSPISIRMAKEQGISLSPQEITGMCGRLRCCLVYEYEQYVEAKKTLPRRGKRVDTPHGQGRVVDVRVLRESVMVRVEGEVHEVFLHELEPSEELEALKKKAAARCDRHENGGCDCGAKSGNGAPDDESEA